MVARSVTAPERRGIAPTGKRPRRCLTIADAAAAGERRIAKLPRVGGMEK